MSKPGKRQQIDWKAVWAKFDKWTDKQLRDWDQQQRMIERLVEKQLRRRLAGAKGY